MPSKLSSSGLVCVIAVLFTAPVVSAATVQVFMGVDDGTLSVSEITTLRVSALVPNGTANNGIWAYALNILGDAAGLVKVNSVTQLGNPDAFFSSTGSISEWGVQDVYGGDGGFLSDRNRGIGSPYGLLNIELEAVAAGTVTFHPGAATLAPVLGVTGGFLLQQQGPLDVDFGSGASVTVIPEPATIGLLLGSLCLVASRRRRATN